MVRGIPAYAVPSSSDPATAASGRSKGPVLAQAGGWGRTTLLPRLPTGGWAGKGTRSERPETDYPEDIQTPRSPTEDVSITTHSEGFLFFFSF